MVATISSWGNSLAVRIPKKEARRIGLSAWSRIVFSSTQDGLLIQPAKKQSEDFAHLLDRAQLLSLSDAQYAAYLRGLSPLEKEEIWRREDGEWNISDAFLQGLTQEAASYFPKKS